MDDQRDGSQRNDTARVVSPDSPKVSFYTLWGQPNIDVIYSFIEVVADLLTFANEIPVHKI